MSLLGIDVGTTGCKAVLFSLEGDLLALAYREYDIVREKPEWAELNVHEVWAKVQEVMREIAPFSRQDPLRTLAVSSMGEAVVPLSKERKVLANSLLNFDARGMNYLQLLGEKLSDEDLYKINGNTLGNHYSMTKLMWLKEHQPEVYAQTDKFLHFSGFISTMLGAEPHVDYSLANRTLLFDIDNGTWSQSLLTWSGLDEEKFPKTVPSGEVIGQMESHLAQELGLGGQPIAIVSGAHDQCANGIGAGVTQEGQAMLGMGTYFTAMPVFCQRQPAANMIKYGINTEHHAAPGLFVSFLYNHAGSMLKWYRDTFAATEAQRSQASIYASLIDEIPAQPSRVMVLPHFEQTGPPRFIADSSGVIAGIKLSTKRADILKGIMESAVFYIRECLQPLLGMGVQLNSFRAVGGGSKSDVWVQMCADILGKPFMRPKTTEAGALGAAIIAAVGVGCFSTAQEGCEAMVKLGQNFEPDLNQHELYSLRYEKYSRLYPLLEDYLRELTTT